ncbi:longiborneol synthase [Fusarium flagelliforme]|uniref:Longiborneol synthase n=1 Tax=Fusarium flagelliforme TaxID=2675880 RepID=A0A395N1R9_9HYPO|nr:longiborneol synthase [Fusarium flagelliforme]
MGASLSVLDPKVQATQLLSHESTQQPTTAPVAQDLRSFIELQLTSVLNELNYAAPAVTENSAIWEGMRLYADKTGVPYDEGTHSGKCFKVGYNYPVLCFPHHPLEVQVFIGIYSWLGLLLDDEAATYLDDFQLFHARFCAGEKQPIPLLQGWADLMHEVFKYWDSTVANFIVSASLNFLNACALQARDGFTQMKRTKAGHSWAWFMRDKDGVGEAYAWFAFPKTLCPDISQFLEMIPDLSAWIGLTNDVLSFWKEEKAGEKQNYIHSRGWYESKDAWDTYEDIVDEVKMKARDSRFYPIYYFLWPQQALDPGQNIAPSTNVTIS